MTATAASAAARYMRRTPYPHQERAFGWAADQRAAMLAIAMGGMKSAITIALLEHDLENARRETCPECHGNWPMTGDGGGMDGGGNHHDPGCPNCDGQGAIMVAPQRPYRVLVLAPKSVVDVWPNQLAEHAVSRWRTWTGEVVGARGKLKNPSVSRRAEALVQATSLAAARRAPFMACVNYEASFQGDMARLLLGTPWDAVILDESHRLKSASGRASKAAAKIAERVRGRGGRVLQLTGTPMPHSPLDLWAQVRALDGGRRLGTSYHQFCQRYGRGETIWAPGGIQRTIYKGVRDDKLSELTSLVGPLMFQVSEDELAEILGLEEPIDVHRTVELDPKTRRAYDELEKDLITRVGEGVITAANAMVLVLRLAQVASGYARDAETGDELALSDGPPEKARLLADVLEDLPVREPVVVFCRFHYDLDAVRAVCEKQGRVYGELSGRRRDGLNEHAQMNPAIDVLGAQIKSGGVGVDLTRARYGIYYTLGFELSDYLQSRKRLHRPGQTRPVVYTHLLAAETVESSIYGALRSRQQVVEAVLARIGGRR